MRPITKELLEELSNASDIDAFLKKHESDFLNKTPVHYLNELITIKNMKISDIARGSGAGEYVYKIFSGERKSSRDILISIAFAMCLTVDETQLLLRISKFAVLDAREKRDSVIIFCLSRGCNVFETDDVLDGQNFVTLN